MKSESFVAKVAGLVDPDLAQCWARVNRGCFDTVTVPLIEAAFAALDYWAMDVGDEPNRIQDAGICGVLSAIASGFSVERNAVRMAEYFHCGNIRVAFSVVRQFELQLAEHVSHVAGPLLKLAESETLRSTPIAMSLQGMAFLALFQFDANYAEQLSLAPARDNCIAGCIDWSRGDSPASRHYADIVTRIQTSS